MDPLRLETNDALEEFSSRLAELLPRANSIEGGVIELVMMLAKVYESSGLAEVQKKARFASFTPQANEVRRIARDQGDLGALTAQILELMVKFKSRVKALRASAEDAVVVHPSEKREKVWPTKRESKATRKEGPRKVAHAKKLAASRDRLKGQFPGGRSAT